MQVYDRSPVCTLALARYLRHPVPRVLTDEIDRLVSQGIYCRQVFLVRPIGFVTSTAARRISYRESLRFGRLHEETYQSYGFHLVDIPPGSVQSRVVTVETHIRAWTSAGTGT